MPVHRMILEIVGEKANPDLQTEKRLRNSHKVSQLFRSPCVAEQTDFHLSPPIDAKDPNRSQLEMEHGSCRIAKAVLVIGGGQRIRITG